MPLPGLIEMVPPTAPTTARVAVPGSKSITNRALVLAALGQGETTLTGALWSEDTQVMVECLQNLGFMVNVAADPLDACNRTITIYGQEGRVPRGGTSAAPLELFVGNAGTVARFLAAMVCLGSGVYRLSGIPRMHQRPQAALFQALRDLGYRVDSDGDRLPALIFGGGPQPGRCGVSIAESSQFASALLLSGSVAGWQVHVTGENADESPYVQMTARLIESFPRSGGVFPIEPDTSSGSYFWAAAALPGLDVMVTGWPATGWQIDERFADYAKSLGKLPVFAQNDTTSKHLIVSRRDDLGDSIMTAIVLAPLMGRPATFKDLGRLRVQECERVIALRTELTRCGARVDEKGDTLAIFPSRLHGAEIETYNDHRMAMCFAVLGLAVPGIRIRNPACVKKTFPNFFQKLAAPPVNGLGAKILDSASGRDLSPDELFAE